MAIAATAADRQSRSGTLTLPVVEIFGPTVQGEGPDAGSPAYFVRFGGCDWRCSWCDSMHAVDPAEVRAHAQRLTTEEIIERLGALAAGPGLVVLSGGNPALLDLGDLVVQLHAKSLAVAVETQGSRWKPWLADVDRLVISPKPPSSGMAGRKYLDQFEEFMLNLGSGQRTALKIVVFDEADLDWAADRHREHPAIPLYLSAGTDVGSDESTTIAGLRERYRWLCETVSVRREFARAKVLPQLHVIAWGTAKGV